MKDRTLAVHLEKLTAKEKGLIVWTLNGTNLLGYQIHLGMLPFVKVEDAIRVLDMYGASSNVRRVAAETKSKLKQAFGVGDHVAWSMKLDGAKVARRFGAHPERGHNIPMVHKKRVTVGVRWNLPKRVHEPDDNVLVQPHLVLEALRVNKGFWKITCEKKYRDYVHTWLNDHCT